MIFLIYRLNGQMGDFFLKQETVPSLKLTGVAPDKMAFPKGNAFSSNHPFSGVRCKLAFRCREGTIYHLFGWV